jgi:hypothetical protein
MKISMFRLLPLVVAGSVLAAVAPAALSQAAPVNGTVLEVKDVPSYTYLRLRTKDGEVWAAVPTAPVKVGAEVSIVDPQPMEAFQSKALNRTFDRILFGTVTSRDAPAAAKPDVGATHAAAKPDMGAMHAAAAKSAAVPAVKVEKAKGPNAQTVAGIVTGAASLKDKPVTVRGQVVKFNADVMGKNWLHLRDGTGSAADGSNDVIVVTSGTAKPGDVVLVSGTVRTDRDFGYGYSYKVLVEDAKVTQ